MAEQKWKKITDKKYQRMTAEGEWVNIDMPYGKVELVFAEFIGGNGLIDAASGTVKTDLMTLIGSFGSVGNIILSEFDAQGNLVAKGNTKALDMTEIPALYQIAIDVIENFMQVISGIRATGVTSGS